MAVDYKRVTRELFGEEWADFEEPKVPRLTEMKRSVAAIAHDHAGRHIFSLRWLPGVKTYRAGKMTRANAVYDVSLPDREYYDPEKRLYVQQWANAIVPLPRFGVYQLVPDTLANRGKWEQNRYIWPDEIVGGERAKVRVDLLGPYPRSGWYREMPGKAGCLSHHLPDRACCREAYALQVNCYGRYRPPSWDFIEWLRQGYFEMQVENQYRMAQEDYTDREVTEFADKRTAEVDEHREKFFTKIVGETADEINSYRPSGIVVVGEPEPSKASGDSPVIVTP